MAYLPFNDDDLLTISEALDIAEDATGNFYKFSLGQWKRQRYDVKTLTSLRANEIAQQAFALLNKGARAISGFESNTKSRDFYFICLQDHQILKALKGTKPLGFYPFLYMFLPTS